MKKTMYKLDSSGRIRGIEVILIVFFVFVLFYMIYSLFLIPPPDIKGTEAFSRLPKGKTITLHGNNLHSLDIVITQGVKISEILEDRPADKEKTYALIIKPRDLGLSDGIASVSVTAKSGFFRKKTYKIDTVIDTIPPSLEVISAPRYVDQGSAGFAKLRSSGADSVYVSVDNTRFNAFKTEEADAGTLQTHAKYVSSFAIPHDIRTGAHFDAVAEDEAGNKVTRPLPTLVREKKFPTISVDISDDFISSVVYPLLNAPDSPDPEDAFTRVNVEWRKRDVEMLREISKASSSDKLWSGRFLQLRNSKVMASYGEERIYLYHGKKISQSPHLGYDLAAVSNAPVEAANTGIVLFASDLGIYGRTVIIDHGLGVLSLYGHLSSIRVEAGQNVRKGEIIGKTGATGLARGDHLHFGILIQGIEISPLFWWDSKWIRDNVDSILNHPS